MSKGYFVIVKNGLYFNKNIDSNFNHWVRDIEDARKFRKMTCCINCTIKYKLKGTEVKCI